MPKGGPDGPPFGVSWGAALERAHHSACLRETARQSAQLSAFRKMVRDAPPTMFAKLITTFSPLRASTEDDGSATVRTGIGPSDAPTGYSSAASCRTDS